MTIDACVKRKTEEENDEDERKNESRQRVLDYAVYHNVVRVPRTVAMQMR